MLLAYPRRYRSVDDDGAPVDYSYADSVAEGERRRQSEPIHRTKDDGTAIAAVYPRPRSNAFAQAPVCAPATPDTLQAAQERAAVSRGEAAPTPASPQAGRNYRRAAHYAEQPDMREQEPEPRQNPFQNAGTVDRAGTPASNAARDSASSARPTPDWLRTAQQNQAFYQPDRRSSGAPTRTPRPDAVDYSAAGYPPELVADQRMEQETMGYAQGTGHRSHGAQAAAPNLRRAYAASDGYRRVPQQNAFIPQDSQPSYESEDPEASPYSVTREPRRPDRRSSAEDESGEEAEENGERKARRVPVLGIVVFAAALLLVGLWIGRITFGNLKTGVLAARAETIRKQADTHPFDYRDLVEREATANNLNPAFIAAIIFNESSFNPRAESSVGARGLMQMMPDTAEWVHGKIDERSEYSFDLMYDPDANVKYACWYLAYLGNRFHNDPVLVAAAFHAGQTTVKNWLSDSRYSADSQTIELQDMAEGPTKNYATRVMNSYAIYRRLYYEDGMPATPANAA